MCKPSSGLPVAYFLPPSPAAWVHDRSPGAGEATATPAERDRIHPFDVLVASMGAGAFAGQWHDLGDELASAIHTR